MEVEGNSTPEAPYLTFLEQLNSKALLKIACQIPTYYWQLTEDEIKELVEPSEALIQLRGRFWDEATMAWHGKSKFSPHKIFDQDKRTYSYWMGHFRRNPVDLVYVLHPLNQLLSIDPSIWGIVQNIRKALAVPTKTKTGTIRYSKVNTLLRFLEILHSAKIK